MKATEETLREYLRGLRIKEKDFEKKIALTIPTVAQAINYSFSKPENADWALMYRIKKEFPAFEREHFTAAPDKPASKKQAPFDPKKIDRTKHSENFEIYFKQHLGARLKSLRKSRGIGARDMAEFIGINAPNYSAMETGRIHIPAYRLFLACLKLNISPVVLMNTSGKDLDSKSLETALSQKEDHITDLQSKIKELESSLAAHKSILNDLAGKIKKVTT